MDHVTSTAPIHLDPSQLSSPAHGAMDVSDDETQNVHRPAIQSLEVWSYRRECLPREEKSKLATASARNLRCVQTLN